MKPLLWTLALGLSLPVLAAELPVTVELNGLPLEIEPLGVPGTESNKVDLIGVPAIKVTNRGNEIASCQFHGVPEESAMTAAPAFEVNPNEQVVMRVPGKYSGGGPLAVLVCQPEGVP